MPMPVAISTIAALEEQVRVQDGLVASARERVDGYRARAETLANRLTELRANEPMDDAAPDANLVMTLATDPASTLDGDAMTAAIERRAATRTAHDGWRTNVSLIEQAIEQVGGYVTYVEELAESQQEERGIAWNAFVREAQAYLAETFRAAVEQLRTDLVEPLLAFSEVSNLGGIAKLDRDSAITMRQHVDGRVHIDKLLKLDGRGWSTGQCEPHIERFRAQLAAMVPAKKG